MPASAASQSERQLSLLVIRGISDEPGVPLESGSVHRKEWMRYAAAAAAAFTFSLIERLPIRRKMIPETSRPPPVPSPGPLSETRVVTEQGHADGSSQIVMRAIDSKQVEKPPMPIAQSIHGSRIAPDRIANQPTDSKPPEKGPLAITQRLQGSKSPADSLAVFFERWTDPSMTKLQKQKFERDWTGEDVRWIVSVYTVSEASNGRIHVAVRDSALDKFAVPLALLIFDERHAEMLQSLQVGDPIV